MLKLLQSHSTIYKNFILFLIIKLIDVSYCLSPSVYYANVGETVRLQCNGPYACFSTYTYQDNVHQMIMLNNSLKYNVMPGSITINNVQATDAGFYACSPNCDQMRSDSISYYLQPMCK